MSLDNLKIKIVLLKNNTNNYVPEYATSHSAGMDIRASIETEITIKPKERALISTGIAIELPEGYEAQIRCRSGLAIKHGIAVLNSPGTIDADYRGEIKVILINHSDEDFIITPGMRIAQCVIAKFTTAKWNIVPSLETSNRGDGGFGSTGTN